MDCRLQAVVVCLALLAGPLSAGAGEGVGEYQVKAAFLYNFSKFVEWPAKAFPAPNSPIRFAVVGEDPFGAELDRALEGKVVGGRPLVLQRFGSATADLRRCHIVFISSSEARRLPDLLELLRGAPVLTVSEMEPFVRAGGVIRLTEDDRHVRFEINVQAAEQEGLQISSKLLALATVVHRAGQAAKRN